MKNRFLLLLVVMLSLLSVAAGYRDVAIYANGDCLTVPGYVINGQTYVPFRAIGEALGAKISWDGKQVVVEKGALKRPPINGDAEFVTKINAALDLLQQNDFPNYVLVCQNAWSINQRDKPLYDQNIYASANGQAQINIYQLLIQDPKRYDAVFLAGILVHENSHLIDHYYGRGDDFQKPAFMQEFQCYQAVNAPKWMQDEASQGM